MKLVLISEKFGEPDDEGIAASAERFLASLRKENEVKAIKPIYDSSSVNASDSAGIEAIKANRYFFGSRIILAVRQFAPDAIVYLPWTSATIRSLLRLKALSLFSGRKAESRIMVFQPEKYNFIERILVHFLRPDYVYSMSRKSLDFFMGIGVEGELYVPQINRERFHRIGKEEAVARFPELASKRVALHVGHLNRLRIEARLIRKLAERGLTPVVVGSPSTPQDTSLIEEIRACGAQVNTERIENLAALYSIAEFYFFPVTNERSSMAIPLSVLEALACGTRVITTKFGSLPEILKDNPLVTFVDSPDEIAEIAAR